MAMTLRSSEFFTKQFHLWGIYDMIKEKPGGIGMPKSFDQKMRILYVWDYLQKNSHESKPVSANELIEMLRKHDIQSERKSLYSDIKCL